MAKIIYGVCGNGHGHAMRAVTVMRRFKQHEYLLVSQGAGAGTLRRWFKVHEVPNPVSPVRDHRMELGTMVRQTVRIMAGHQGHQRRVRQLMEDFQPDLAITDYEFYVPLLSRKLGVPCLSLDHQHVISGAKLDLPRGKRLEYLGAYLAILALYNKARAYIASSFFLPPPRPGSPVHLVGPILRDELLACAPTVGEHVIAYQGHTTFQRFLPFLEQTSRPVLVYGFDSDHQQGNLRFRKFSEARLLEDLAGCAYVICGAGHTLVSEALYLGKPVLSFPVKNMFEQSINAHYLELLGMGMCRWDFRPQPGLIAEFEGRLDRFQANIGAQDFCGNQAAFDLVESFLNDRQLPLPAA